MEAPLEHGFFGFPIQAPDHHRRLRIHERILNQVSILDRINCEERLRDFVGIHQITIGGKIRTPSFGCLVWIQSICS
jgi:hypothetical protein